MAKVRVYELAIELGMQSKDILMLLQQMGEYVRSASSTLEPAVVRAVTEKARILENTPVRHTQSNLHRPLAKTAIPKPSPALFGRGSTRGSTNDTSMGGSRHVEPATAPGKEPETRNALLPGRDAARPSSIRDALIPSDQYRPPTRPEASAASRRPGWHAGAIKAPSDSRLLALIEALCQQFPDAAIHLDALRRLGSQIVYVGKSFGAIRPVRVRFSGAIESAFGLTREVLFLYCPYADLQTKTIDEARRILKSQDSFVAPDIVFISSPDQRLSTKLEDWSTPSLLLVPLLPSIRDDPQALIRILRANVYSRDLFYTTTPVDGARFFGRKILLQELRDDVRQRRVAGIYGLRKAGKTSVLMELSSTADPGLVPVLVDLESFPCPPEDATGEILAHISRRLRTALAARGLSAKNLSAVVPSMPITAWKQVTQETLDQLGQSGISVLLLLDEVEYLTSDKVDVEEGDMPRISQMLAAFRSLAQESTNFSFMISGLASSLTESGRLYGRPNPLFSWAKTYYVSPFTRDEAEDLTRTLGAKMGINFEQAALEALYEGSGGHAFLYRSLASAAVEQLSDTAEDRRIGVTEIQRAYLPWRGAVAGHVREMIDHVRRYYGVEALMVESLVGDGQVFEALAKSEPQAVAHLMKLGLVYESEQRYHLNSMLELSL